MLSFSVLASGSRANCIFVEGAGTRVLIDCGLSAKQTAIRLEQRGIDPSSIEVIVVTHEHSDHVKGIRVFCKRHKARVVVNSATLAKCKDLREVHSDLIEVFESRDPFSIGGLSFEPFSVTHDAVDPVGFRVSCGSAYLGVVTDLGQVTNLVRESIRDLHGLVLEANHDPKMLEDAPYPWELKQRIGSRQGHLSNETAGALLEELSAQEKQSRLQVVVAAHISENSNTPELAVEVLRQGWQRGGSAVQPGIIAASPDEATELFRLGVI